MLPMTDETFEAINGVAKANAEFIAEAMELFTPAVLPAEFTADHVTHAGGVRGLIPTNVRAYGPVILRALSENRIVKTGEWRLPTYAPPNGHTSKRQMPVYRLA